MKKLLTVCIAAIMLFMCCKAAFAAVTVELDGHNIPSDVAPIVQNGRTLVPLRTVSQALGATVMWRNNEACIKTYEGEKMRFTPGSKTAVYEKTDGTKTSVKLDAPAVMRDNRVMVPLRVIAETFDVKTDYQNGKVSLSSTPVYLEGQPLTCMTQYTKMTLGGYTYAYYGNANVARAYQIMQKFTQQEIADPTDGKGEEVLMWYNNGEYEYNLSGIIEFYNGRPKDAYEDGLVTYRIYYYWGSGSSADADIMIYHMQTQKWYRIPWEDWAASGLHSIWPKNDTSPRGIGDHGSSAPLTEEIFNDWV